MELRKGNRKTIVFWTKEEELMLKTMKKAGTTYDECSVALSGAFGNNRSPYACKKKFLKLEKLDIKAKSTKTWTRYSEAEIKLIKQLRLEQHKTWPQIQTILVERLGIERTMSGISVSFYNRQTAATLEKAQNKLKDKTLDKLVDESKEIKSTKLLYGKDIWDDETLNRNMKEFPIVWPTLPDPETSKELIENMCNQIRVMLLEKNNAYGDSALSPIRIFSKSDSSEQLKVRIDDKLSRIKQGEDTLESDDDVIKDLIGYLILLLIQRKE